MTITKRYFLDRNGVPTKRMAGEAGAPHKEIAQMELGPILPDTDWYDQMFKLKFARVAEDASTNTVYVDAPQARTVNHLTNGQRRYIQNMQSEGWTVVFNSREFTESRDRIGK